MTHLFSTYEGLAFVFAGLIFLITILLVVTRVIGFWITFLLLLFSLATGIVIGNFGNIRDYLQCRNQQKMEQIETEYQKLNEKMDLIYRDFDQLKEQKNHTPPEEPVKD